MMYSECCRSFSTCVIHPQVEQILLRKRCRILHPHGRHPTSSLCITKRGRYRILHPHGRHSTSSLCTTKRDVEFYIHMEDIPHHQCEQQKEM